MVAILYRSQHVNVMPYRYNTVNAKVTKFRGTLFSLHSTCKVIVMVCATLYFTRYTNCIIWMWIIPDLNCWLTRLVCWIHILYNILCLTYLLKESCSAVSAQHNHSRGRDNLYGSARRFDSQFASPLWLRLGWDAGRMSSLSRLYVAVFKALK